jgi:uncharacterized membrane protein YfcA
MRDMTPSFLTWMSIASLAGSLAGSFLLLHTSNLAFSMLVPWLLFSGGGVQRRTLDTPRRSIRGKPSFPALLVGQFAISTYGGYFGAGMGVLMLALYLAVANLDVHAASGLRSVCSVAINALAVVIFAARGALDYKRGIPMLFAGIAGGYWAPTVSRSWTRKRSASASLYMPGADGVLLHPHGVRRLLSGGLVC